MQSKFADFPKGAVTVWEGTEFDPPDAVIDNTGIEVVDYVRESSRERGSKIRATEIRYERITKEAQRLFETKNKTRLWLSFSWKSFELPDKKQDVELATAVVELVTKFVPKKVGEEIVLEEEQFANTILTNYLDGIRITKLPNDEENHRSDPSAGWTRTGIAELQQLILDKEADLPKYRQKFKAVWLIIVADSSYISSVVTLAADVQPGCIASKFDCVCFFNLLDMKRIILTS